MIFSTANRLRKLVLFSAAAVLAVTTSGTQPVLASFWSDNSIYHYHPDATSVDVCGGGGFEDTGDNLRSIFNYFTIQGLSDVQAAGVIGNIMKETEQSPGDPTIIQGGTFSNDPNDAGSGGYGIIQWTPGSRLLTYIDKYNIDGPPHLLQTQVQVLWNHMKKDSPTGDQNMLEKPGGGFPAYKDITDVAEAAVAFHDRIEGSADETMDARIGFAKQALDDYGGGSGSVGVASSGNCLITGNGSIVDTALMFAWKDGNYKRPHLDMMPAYEEATEKAIAAGEFVGGGGGTPGYQRPGVDCGGYVTRVMRVSGVDPEYNNKNGNTTAQQAYLSTSDKYERITVESTADLRPGDIAIRLSGLAHTFIYVGENDYFNKDTSANGGVTAESSYGLGTTPKGGLAPQAGWSTPTDPAYEIYRFIDTSDKEGA